MPRSCLRRDLWQDASGCRPGAPAASVCGKPSPSSWPGCPARPPHQWSTQPLLWLYRPQPSPRSALPSRAPISEPQGLRQSVSAAGIHSWNSDWGGQMAQPFPVAALRLWGGWDRQKTKDELLRWWAEPPGDTQPTPWNRAGGEDWWEGNSPLPKVTPGASLEQRLSGGPAFREQSPEAGRNVPDKSQRPRQAGQGLVCSFHGVWVWVPPAGFLMAEFRECSCGRPGALSHGAQRPGMLAVAKAMMRAGCGGPAPGSGWAQAAS